MEEEEEMQHLREENEQLLSSVQQLRELIDHNPTTILHSGYLYKHNSEAGFLGKQWELRFFSLTTKTLSFWKSEAESESGRHPRGRYVVGGGWVIHLKQTFDAKYLDFTIENDVGDGVVRLRGGPKEEAGRWVSALQLLGFKTLSNMPNFPLRGVSEVSSDGVVSRPHEDLPNFPLREDSEVSSERGVSSPHEDLPLDGVAPKQTSSSKSEIPSQDSGSSMKNNTPRPSALAHTKPKESPLSSDAIFKQTHAGLFNLCIVVLVAVNSRLIIENIMKYGLLIRSGFWVSSKCAKDWPLLMCGLTLSICPFVAFLIEKLRAHNYLSDHALVVMHLINCSVELAYPMYVIGRVNSELLPGVILMEIAITGWLKLVSYAHTNADLRSLALAGEKSEVPINAPLIEYPQNITLANMAYFIVAPTLCYQPSYPRSPTLRKRWILRQLGKLVVFTSLMGFIVEQYVNPTIRNSQHPLKGNYLYAIERVLKLSIPVLYVWLCMFYCFFHLWFNIVAEVMYFGDREFYKDWWNAKTVEEYWRMWNMPVHKWLVRHVYFPCIRHGASKHVASMVTFAISAIFHEICIGTPCHMLRAWAFLGIMFQVPLVVLTNWLQRKFKSSIVGNMIFWFFFCIVGQPMCVLLYYHDVVNQQQVSTA